MALTFDDDQRVALIEALGLPADTDDPDLVVATVTDLAAQAAGLNPEMPSTVAAAARKAGLEVVDIETLTTLRHDAQEGRKIAAAAAQQKIEAAVDDAVSKGKITPARRRHWVTLAAADPGMLEVLASVPDETAAPMVELGHAVDSEPVGAGGSEWFY
ncbi:hypothetical protein AU191_16820 [Mycolicibacterium acapulense]|nr:hypothetical protein AU191_16820 [Mycolicibacterium acapulense]